MRSRANQPARNRGTRPPEGGGGGGGGGGGSSRSNDKKIDDPELVDFGGPLMQWHVHDNLCWKRPSIM
ncbi:hypothetical protein [Nocardia cyriacigeorgica]|uniref:hypothetical protein n=1 Tax=Nocardia cyriacigeorgica TaxID=135487 RepID=UPI0024579FA2|nr:hypothetical protein [Nocardia cyriacigeorgica]